MLCTWREWQNELQAGLDSMGLVGQLPRKATCLVIFMLSFEPGKTQRGNLKSIDLRHAKWYR